MDSVITPQQTLAQQLALASPVSGLALQSECCARKQERFTKSSGPSEAVRLLGEKVAQIWLLQLSSVTWPSGWWGRHGLLSPPQATAAPTNLHTLLTKAFPALLGFLLHLQAITSDSLMP